MRLWNRSIAGGMGLMIAAVTVMGQAPSTNDNLPSAALVLEQQGRLSDAETAWQAVVKSHPSDAEAYAHLGLLKAHQEHYKDAVPFYLKALALNPQIPGLRLNLGLAYFKAGNLKSAVETFTPLLRQAAEGSPDALRMETLIGLADYGMGAYGAAVPHLRKATAADQQDLPFRLMLAHSCLWSKQYQCVLDTYREILTLNPGSAEADMLAGEAYDEMKNETGAIEQFQAAVKADPKVPNVHFGYGYLLWRILRFNDAEREFKSELENNPEHPLALTYLADTEIHLNHSDEAASYLERALRIDSTIALAHLDLGILYRDLGHNDDALRELKAAESLTPDDHAILWQLGRTYQSLGRQTEAKAEFEKVRNLQNTETQSLREKMNQLEPQSVGRNTDMKPK
jgi:tetratricopeptide (TPR) repeat protein